MKTEGKKLTIKGAANNIESAKAPIVLHKFAQMPTHYSQPGLFQFLALNQIFIKGLHAWPRSILAVVVENAGVDEKDGHTGFNVRGGLGIGVHGVRNNCSKHGLEVL